MVRQDTGSAVNFMVKFKTDEDGEVTFWPRTYAEARGLASEKSRVFGEAELIRYVFGLRGRCETHVYRNGEWSRKAD